MKLFAPEVGMVVVRADGASYRGEVIFVSKEKDTVRHRCLKTGRVQEKSYHGFQIRYRPEESRKREDLVLSFIREHPGANSRHVYEQCFDVLTRDAAKRALKVLKSAGQIVAVQDATGRFRGYVCTED